jgi:hypothetical protein
VIYIGHVNVVKNVKCRRLQLIWNVSIGDTGNAYRSLVMKGYSENVHFQDREVDRSCY